MDDKDLVRVKCTSDNCACALRGGWIYLNRGEWSPEIVVENLKQKGKDLYLGHAPGRLLDAISNVPSVEVDAPSLDLAINYHKHRKYPMWQRQVDASRINSIGDFWYRGETTIANSVTLGAREKLADYKI